jgi:hypothetical protein
VVIELMVKMVFPRVISSIYIEMGFTKLLNLKQIDQIIF